MNSSAIKLPRVLNVYLNEVEVGTLTLMADDRTFFAFAQPYIQNSARPTLSLWFKTRLGELKTEEQIRSQAMLPPFFSNLLPEGHLREYLAKRAKVKSEREFFLLAALGKDLPGAVRIQSSEDVSDESPRSRTKESFDDKTILRFSLAGIQLKFSAVMEMKGGLTIPAEGVGGSWIVKLPSNSFAKLPEAEYSMLRLAQHIGINVPEFKLVPTNSISGLPKDINENFGDSLAIKRFDRRDDGTRIHMEDFAQVFGQYPAQKYEDASFDQIAYVLLSEGGDNDLLEFIRRLVFMIVTGNGDMHLKNWSLLYSDTLNAKLSPAYDLVPSMFYMQNDDLGLRLGGTRSLSDVTKKHFIALASRAQASERMVLNTVYETIEQLYDAWKDIRTDLLLTHELRKSLDKHLGNKRKDLVE